MPEAALKMYWWNALPNFGDALAPKVLEWVSGRRVLWSPPEEAEWCGLGSILGPALREAACRDGSRPRLNVWGSGMMSPAYVPRRQQGRLHVAALRGPLTASCLEHDHAVTGDPGLLVRRMYPDAKGTATQYRGGLVLHHTQRISDRARDILARNDWIVISAATNDYEDVIARVAACDAILSSSLHGLVVADALRVPNRWVEAGQIHAASRFKFYDYATGIGRALRPPISLTDLNLGRAMREVQDIDRGYWERIDAVNDGLVRSFAALEGQ